ncbi:MAG: hypothetical protein JXA33_13900 [Anaerolineae bacterium]|nr:hypothetical protein [Anaerolineae bacterium]
MRIIADARRIKRRTRVGEISPLLGLAVLIGSTVLLFVAREQMWLTMILVWVGFVFSLIGSYLGERYVGPLAHHRAVPEALEKLDDDYVLLMYKTPVAFVLVEPGGLTAVMAKSHSGAVAFKDGKWQHHVSMRFFRRMAGQEKLDRVERDAALELEMLQEYLAKRLPSDVKIPVRTVLLFVHPDVQLETRDAPLPAFKGAQLARWLRKSGKQPELPKATQQQLAEVLDG